MKSTRRFNISRTCPRIKTSAFEIATTVGVIISVTKALMHELGCDLARDRRRNNILYIAVAVLRHLNLVKNAAHVTGVSFSFDPNEVGDGFVEGSPTVEIKVDPILAVRCLNRARYARMHAVVANAICS